MNLRKLAIPALLLLLAVGFSGCGTSGRTALGPRESNLLGLVSREDESFKHVGGNTIHVSSDELVARNNVSGDKVTLLWGLVTLTDY